MLDHLRDGLDSRMAFLAASPKVPWLLPVALQLFTLCVHLFFSFCVDAHARPHWLPDPFRPPLSMPNHFMRVQSALLLRSNWLCILLGYLDLLSQKRDSSPLIPLIHTSPMSYAFGLALQHIASTSIAWAQITKLMNLRGRLTRKGGGSMRV